MDNEQRVAIAQDALMTMPVAYGVGDQEAAITDLITNLLHLAKVEDLDPVKIAAMALFHYQAEV